MSYASSQDRQAAARAAADALEQGAARVRDLRLLCGFDGFIDSIIRVVRTRTGPHDFDAMTSMDEFAERIQTNIGKSINIELLPERVKIGGNGPLMAHPLTKLGGKVVYIGAIAEDPPAGAASPIEPSGAVHPVFTDFAASCEKVFAVASPGKTDACEFLDGKVLLGKTHTQHEVTWDRVVHAVGGVDALTRHFAESDLFAPMNWTMLSGMTEIWRRVTVEILPKIPRDRRPQVFIDLADPAKRSPEDLADAMRVLQEMDGQTDVTLGVNMAESGRIARVLGLTIPEEVEPRAVELRAKLDIAGVCVHTRMNAAAATRDGRSSLVDAAFTRTPAISTGAGDNFNAGYTLGLMLDLPLDQRLALAAATSGFYVRNRQPATLDALTDFLRHLPEPEVAQPVEP